MLEQHWQSFVLVDEFGLSFDSNFFEVTLQENNFAYLYSYGSMYIDFLEILKYS